MDWQVQQAKQRFSEVLRQAERDGAQVVTRHGEPIAVVVPMWLWRDVAQDHDAFKELLLAGRGVELPAIERDPAPARVVEL